MNQNELMHYGVKGMKWGHRKNYYGSSGDKYRASNGVTVGAPKNAGVAAFRKVQGSKAGGAAIKGIAKVNTAVSGRRNKAIMKRIEERTRKETDAVREANQAHKQAKKDAKQPMSTKKKVAIGAAVVGTAAVAAGTVYVAKKINNKSVNGLKKEYEDMGKEWLSSASLYRSKISEFTNRQDGSKIMFGASSDSYKINKNIANEYQRKMELSNKLADEYLGKAKNGSFSTKEKIDYLKRNYHKKQR